VRGLDIVQARTRIALTTVLLAEWLSSTYTTRPLQSASGQPAQ
jgi:hypothetical protein